MTKGGYTNSADVFAKRGDPWVTKREGEKLFGRNMETENPDLDALLFATFVQPKAPYVDPPATGKSATASYSERKLNIILRAKRQAFTVNRPKPDDENPFERFVSRGVVDD